MTLVKTLFALTLAGSLCACTAANEKTETSAEVIATETAQKSKFVAPMITVKPGADVSLNSVLPKSMTSGSYQTVQLQLQEGYGGGVLSVNVTPSEGLQTFGGASSKAFNMAEEGPHIWDVDVKADVDGVYFLNVFSEANGQNRSFSVRIDMGSVTQKMFDDAMPADGEMSDGGKIRVLDADETIK